MSGPGQTLFDTPIGTCGIAWTPRGIAALQLPESSVERTRTRLLRRLAALGLGGAPITQGPGEPPDDVRCAIEIGRAHV